MTIRIAVVDYGAGNLFNIEAALAREGASVRRVAGPASFARYDGIVLPGVGHFGPAARALRRRGNRVCDAIRNGIPVLGICLGLQLLFERSEEGAAAGLGILEGDVVMLPRRCKTPQMGWNTVRVARRSDLLRGIRDDSWFYFAHSYRVRPRRRSMVVGVCEYGIEFPAAMESGNVFGTQFHPEKSAGCGAVVLRNFLERCRP
ncbi:MAG: imidazole glycerol phosphate synthase subunit HisH [Planctomycetota bacterium]|nr:imidazole glycerol phosphate synthase subunit HisH [Planctomycetota bacterium]